MSRQKKSEQLDEGDGSEMSEQQWAEMLAKKSKITMYIVSITIGTIVVFGGLGYLIDYYLGSKPLVMLAMLLISFPINQVIIYKKVKKDILK